MSEAAATPPPDMDVVATDRPPQSPNGSDLTVVVASPIDESVNQDTMLPQPGSGVAILSTELGARPKRGVSQPAPPIIVRSGYKLYNIWHSANYWRMKYPRIGFAIFPDRPWTIEDFWDDEDIRIETRDHLQAVLDYTNTDNAISAGLYAQDWSYPKYEQWAKYMEMDDLKSIADPNDPLGIVDKLFVDGELGYYPRTFLWHAAQAMRTTLVLQRAQPAMGTSSASTLAPSKDQLTETTKRSTTTTTQGGEALQAPVSSIQSELPTSKARRSSLAVPYNAPVAFIPSALSVHKLQRPAVGRRVPSQTMSGPSLPNPKSRPARSNAYSHPYPPGTYSENATRNSSGAYSRMPPTHSPHYNHAATAMVPAGMPPHAAQPFGPGYPPISPSAHFAQPYHPNLAHPGLVPPQHMQPSNTFLPPGYVQQAPHGRGLRGISMGDITNTHYYTNDMPSHNMETRRTDRRASFYNSGSNALFDPYNGARPAFNDHNTGRKSSRGGFIDQGSRPRKHSGLDHRPRNASYGSEWAEPTTTSGGRYYDHRMTRNPREDDPKIISDPIRGCYQTWIGPENNNVNELFVSDLPQNVLSEEVQEMFMREVSIFPVKALVKHNAQGGHPHAFVMFATTADAKLALRASEGNPNVRGMPVRISVPRRFYQKIEDYHNQYQPHQQTGRHAEVRDVSNVVHTSAHEEAGVNTGTEAQIAKLQYSPQDARSDLQKKTDRLYSEGDFKSEGSAETQQTQEGQLSLTQPTAAHLKQPIANDASTENSTSQSGQESNAKTGTIKQEEEGSERATVIPQSADTDAENDETPSAASLETPQTLPDNVSAPVEDSLSQSPTPKPTATSGHARVESQTRATFEGTEVTSDISEIVATVVNIPHPTEDADSLAKQAPTLNEAAISTAVDLVSGQGQEVASDEDAGPDSSFLSAQEMVETAEKTIVPRFEVSTANHGIEPSRKVEPKGPLPEESALPALTINPEAPEPLPLSTDQNNTAPMSTTIEDKTGVEDTPVLVKNTHSIIATPSPPTASVGKKQGPQQTPSLNPFAKLKKTQRKKEKEQKKKASKVKADKTALASGVKDSLPSTKQEPEVHSTDAVASAIPTQAQTSAAATRTSPLASRDTDDGKVKAAVQVEIAAADASTQASKDEPKDKNAGKPNISDAIGSVTLKAKVEQKVTTAPVENSSSVSAPRSRAQSPKYEDVPGPKQTAVLGPVDEGKLVKASTESIAPKLKKAVPAVPFLNLKAKSSSTRTQGTQPSSTTPSLVPAASASTHPPLHNMSQPAREADAVSVASSDTLHPSDIGHPSPSPAAEDFHTPLQTPTVPDTPQEQTAKPKKKKNKSKKKKKAAVPTAPAAEDSVTDAEIESTNNFDHEADPFGNQMSHIDAIREGLKNENTYYNQVNQRMAERNAKIKSGEIKAGEDSEGDMGFGADPTNFRQLQAFFMENPDMVQKMEEKAKK